MAQIYNSDLSKELVDGAKIQTSYDKVPNQLADKVVPVMEVNPKLFRISNVVRNINTTASGAQTMYTTPTDKEFYLTGLYFSIIKDAACDMASGAVTINASVDGVSRTLFGIAVLTATAQNSSITFSFPTPVKVDKGAGIVYSGTFAAGTCARTGGINGYLVENINA